jgi:glycosyltransferase involved in cell wall biosynthesis
VVLAPNGVDFDGIDKMLKALPSASHHSWGRIVSVGNLYRIKGIHENLHALKRLGDSGIQNWSYTVVGDGPYLSELKGLAATLGLKDKVRFTGKLPQTEAIRMIRDADIFSLPSWAESFGNAYAEAAVCERAAIGCVGQGAEIMIQGGVTGLLVPPRDVDALADALALLLKGETMATAMGKTAREQIRGFTWEKTAQLYAREFAEVLSGDAVNADVPVPETRSVPELV